MVNWAVSWPRLLPGGTLYLPEVFQLFVTKETVDVFKVLFYALVAKLKDFGGESVKKIPVVGDKDERSIKSL